MKILCCLHVYQPEHPRHPHITHSTIFPWKETKISTQNKYSSLAFTLGLYTFLYAKIFTFSETSCLFSILMMYHYPVLGSASDWLRQIFHTAWPIRSTILIWVDQWCIISMEFLPLLLTCHFTWKAVMTSQNVGYFLRLIPRLFQGFHWCTNSFTFSLSGNYYVQTLERNFQRIWSTLQTRF